MLTKQVLKKEIDYVRDEHLEALYNIIRAFSLPMEDNVTSPDLNLVADIEDWQSFIQATYGCLADDPIERGAQGDYETRLSL
ncbi:hypothetical protein [Candidatus Entotheonella palauensis]|uniref:Uncharacterized protein n=1 Tax=Candidatus Entotheonella gemina TaxID=1429439 RepID=W4M4Z1_9BACT|nr:hypothetical protein [Candidatus Entotheonella palauensis]ETX05248.1 MAG: hypothetical protein ETSY2_24080 [Candidatus Entotheonella gemina]